MTLLRGYGAPAVAFRQTLLGTNRASTPFGALEAHSMIVEASAEKIADALHDVAEAIRGA